MRGIMGKVKNTVSQRVIARFIKGHLGVGGEQNSSPYDLACVILEKYSCYKLPNYSAKEWVEKNYSFICMESEKFRTKRSQRDSDAYCKYAKFNAEKIELNIHILPIKKPAKKKKDFVMTDEFLRSFPWRKLRMQAITKYGNQCQCCGASPKTGAVINVDHIKPRKLFPALALDITNLQILCGECNHGKGNWDSTDWR